jgi:hypothetical protein
MGTLRFRVLRRTGVIHLDDQLLECVIFGWIE